MVRIINTQMVAEDKQYIEASGLSTDEKPEDGIATGSLFMEVDTKKIYAFDEDGADDEKWVEQCALGGA